MRDRPAYDGEKVFCGDVVQEAYIQGASTRSVHELVKAMGMTGISKSQVSRLCGEIDERVGAFLNRPIEGDWPYLWIDATQKDLDARWTKKRGQTYYGYKNHINADQEYTFIREYTVTDAAIHDSQVCDDVIDPLVQDRAVYADSAYRSAARETSLTGAGIASRIHERAHVNVPLIDASKAANREKSSVRVRIEHIFDFLTNIAFARACRRRRCGPDGPGASCSYFACGTTPRSPSGASAFGHASGRPHIHHAAKTSAASELPKDGRSKCNSSIRRINARSNSVTATAS